MRFLPSATVLLFLIVSLSPAALAQETGRSAEMMEGYVPDSLSRATLAPLVKGYYEDGDAFFIHTEASDRKVARMLTKMMGPRVVHLPKLRQVPASVTAPIYVFENGVEGRGPLGYQPDVFGAVPGEKSYSPLHEIHLVRWKEGAEARELQAATAIQEARNDGQLTIQPTGTVINAPVLAWPGGRR